MTLPCTEHFRAMAYAQLTWRESLRDIEATLGANSSKLYGMGFRQPVRRSTLADANERRDWRIWHDLAVLLIDRARKLHAQDELDLDVNIAGNVYALDSTTIDLCLSLFDWAPFRSTKAAVKLHTLLDLRGNIPSFIHISDANMGDVTVLDILPVEPGAFYVMDRGYVDFERLYTMHQAGAFFVTGAKSLRAYPQHIRRVRFHDPITDKTLVFLTNNTSLPACVITQLYKNRWQVELFFKWIKQHLRIKKFLGTSENAVKTQIWCAISTYVLIAVVRKELNLKTSHYTSLQILSVSVFEKTHNSCALRDNDYEPDRLPLANQLILFNF